MKKTSLGIMCIVAALFIFVGSAWCYTEGTSETFLGQGAGHDYPGGTFYSTFVGVDAGHKNTTGAWNTYVGVNAGYNNESGNANTIVGVNAGQANTASDNTFIGLESGYTNSTGYQNTFVGSGAGRANTQSWNSFFGSFAGSLNIGFCNTFLGASAGKNNVNGYENVFVGTSAGISSTGVENVFLGYYAGKVNTGDGNVFIGHYAGYNETGSNKLYIANSDIPTPLIYGEFNNYLVKIHGKLIMAEASMPSDVRYKKNIEPLRASLDKITKLKGVSYEWKTEENKGKGFSKGRQIGLIAQDVEAVIPELVYTDEKGYKFLSYDKLVPVLVEAIKEQQGVINGQAAEIKELTEKLSRLDKLEAKISRLESRNLTAQK